MRVLELKSSGTRGEVARHGFTLIELLVAMVIFGLVAGGVMQVIISSQRASADQAQRIDMQQNMRAANAILPSEIRALNAVDGDIQTMTANSLTIRGIRQLAIICTPPVTGGVLTGLTLVVRHPLYSSQRAFAQGDSLWIWYEGDVGVRSDDGWIPGLLTLAPVAQNCTDGTPGVRLTATISIAAPKFNLASVVPNGSPVWGFESGVNYATGLGADGRYYLNLTSSQGTARVIGPLPDANGVTFTYYDAAGAVTATPTFVRQIGLSIRSQSVNRIKKGATTAYAVDSLSTRITLRNNPRF